MARNFENLRNDKRNGAQFAYVLDSIDHEGSDREKVAYFFECFTQEFDFDYNRRRYPNTAERIGEYLQGLPSCCSVAFSDWDIEQQGKKWGFCGGAKKSARFVANWWRILGARLVTLKEAACI